MAESIRQAAVAGRFYPDDTGRLVAFMQEHVAPESAGGGRAIRAVIAPHAGYQFSGRTAGQAFHQIAPGSFSRAIVLGPTHYLAFRGLAVAPHECFRTPLGDARIDTVAAREIADGDHRFSLRPDAHQQEHAIEVLIPFIQYLNPDALLLPIAVGEMTLQDVYDAADRLLPFWNEETLVVVSSDFTHYGAHFNYFPFSTREAAESLRTLDGGAIEQIKLASAEGFLAYVERTGATICGRFPIAVLLAMMEKKGGLDTIDLIDYTTSGELTRDYSSSVSYASITISD